jgi:hypothetical protein
MKKQIILLLVILRGQIGFSQTHTPEVYATSGGYYTSTNCSLSWTLGESVIETYSNTNNIFTQGFQQSSYFITSVKENINDAFPFSVYPNPTNSFINICYESTELKKLKADLMDITGKLLHSETFQNNLQLNLSGYTSSLYFIRIFDENNNSVKTFKITKT